MLLAGFRLINAPVMGLQTGGELARTKQAIIDPRTLQIIAYEVSGMLLAEQPSLLRVADVREFSDVGLIIDSSDEFVSPSDIIKLQEVYDLHFELMAIPVIDKKHRKLGKVTGYTIETSSFVVQQLTVKRPLWKSMNDTELLIHRSQIVEINDRVIIVEQEAATAEPVLDSVKSVYANPFRKNQQPEHRDQT